jgi:hypothetical protein
VSGPTTYSGDVTERPAPPSPERPETVAGAVAHAGALWLRDLLLNGGVLLSLVVGVGGAMSGEQPWRWLGPLVGVIGVVLSFAAHRVRVVRTTAGEQRRTLLPAPAIWAAAIGVPVVAFVVMWLMWG